MAKGKATLNTTFVKGNFSADLRNDVPSKTDFVKTHKGKLNVDIDSLHAELVKAKSSYNKANGKPSKEK